MTADDGTVIDILDLLHEFWVSFSKSHNWADEPTKAIFSHMGWDAWVYFSAYGYCGASPTYAAQLKVGDSVYGLISSIDATDGAPYVRVE